MTLTETCGCGASFKVEDYARVDIPAAEAKRWRDEHAKVCTFYTQTWEIKGHDIPEPWATQVIKNREDFAKHFTPENMEDRS